MALQPERDVVSWLTERAESLAVAESLTGGQVAAQIVSVPGASAVLRGAVVAYQKSVKAHVLGVDPDVLEREGAVSEAVVRQMAEGVRHCLDGGAVATWGLATTGVAGPDPDPDTGALPGEVWIAVAGPSGTHAVHLALTGDREEIRRQASSQALDTLRDSIARSGE